MLKKNIFKTNILDIILIKKNPEKCIHHFHKKKNVLIINNKCFLSSKLAYVCDFWRME